MFNVGDIAVRGLSLKRRIDSSLRGEATRESTYAAQKILVSVRVDFALSVGYNKTEAHSSLRS